MLRKTPMPARADFTFNLQTVTMCSCSVKPGVDKHTCISRMCYSLENRSYISAKFANRFF